MLLFVLSFCLQVHVLVVLFNVLRFVLLLVISRASVSDLAHLCFSVFLLFLQFNVLAFVL